MRPVLTILAVALATASVGATETTDVVIETKRGTELQGRLSYPARAEGRLPAVVLAPGWKYDMDKPLIKRTGEELTEAGFVVLRFNWGFFTHKLNRSTKRFAEKQDLRAALAFVRRLENVDQGRVYVVAKSMACRVAAEVASAGEPMNGLVLMTIPLHIAGDQEQLHPVGEAIPTLELPLMIVCGEQDPTCRPDAVKKLAQACKSRPEMLFVPGKHQLESESPEVTEKSIRRAARGVADWLKNRASMK